MSFDSRIKSRVKHLARKTGTSIIYRKIDRTSGPNPSVNPATADAAQTVGAASAGASSLTITATALRGYVVPGDRIIISGHPTAYTITNTVTASGNTLTGVTFTPVLASPVSGGTAITFGWLNDTTILARISSKPIFNKGDTLVQDGDLSVIVPALSIAFPPRQVDKLIIAGVAHTIVSSTPGYARNEVAIWTIQARR